MFSNSMYHLHHFGSYCLLTHKIFNSELTDLKGIKCFNFFIPKKDINTGKTTTWALVKS